MMILIFVDSNYLVQAYHFHLLYILVESSISFCIRNKNLKLTMHMVVNKTAEIVIRRLQRINEIELTTGNVINDGQIR